MRGRAQTVAVATSLCLVACASVIALVNLYPSAEPVILTSAPLSDPVLLKHVNNSMQALSLACSGPKIDPVKCSSFWTEDTTVYNLQEGGAMRGRQEWEEALAYSIKTHPIQDTFKTILVPDDAGYIGGGTPLAWMHGVWRKETSTGTLLAMGTISAILKMEHDIWKLLVVAPMSQTTENFELMMDGHGDDVLDEAQDLMQHFASNYNRNDLDSAFEVYTPDARFPCMQRLGGDTLAFAKKELLRQKRVLIPVHMTATVDEVLYPIYDHNPNIAIAHGFTKSTDTTRMWVFGRFSYVYPPTRLTIRQFSDCDGSARRGVEN